MFCLIFESIFCLTIIINQQISLANKGLGEADENLHGILPTCMHLQCMGSNPTLGGLGTRVDLLVNPGTVHGSLPLPQGSLHCTWHNEAIMIASDLVTT